MKKGFTIVELIISIALIVLVGTTSVISYHFIDKKNNEKSLNAMSNKILEAVNVLVETDSETKKQLYEEKNGVVIPLTKLQNEGLIDFQDLDIEDEYVVTMLGSTSESDKCESTYTAKSWNLSDGEVIYVCTKSNGTQNLVSVAGQADNLSKATRERYYFRGLSSANYMK